MSTVPRVVSIEQLAVDTVAGLVADVLIAGGVALIPTDTVYGLAVLASGPGAVGALARIKGRDPNKPVAVLVASPAQGLGLFDRPDRALARLATALWPGPLTLVAPAGDRAPAPVVATTGSIGVRCPDDQLVRRVAELVGPLAVTSANPAGDEPLVRLGDLTALTGRWPALVEASLVVDGGPLPGTASTVVEVPAAADGPTGPRVLRTGPIDAGTIAELWCGSVK